MGGIDAFNRGTDVATRVFSDNKREGTHKGFSDIRKGKLMGWCRHSMETHTKQL